MSFYNLAISLARNANTVLSVKDAFRVSYKQMHKRCTLPEHPPPPPPLLPKSHSAAVDKIFLSWEKEQRGGGSRGIRGGKDVLKRIEFEESTRTLGYLVNSRGGKNSLENRVLRGFS